MSRLVDATGKIEQPEENNVSLAHIIIIIIIIINNKKEIIIFFFPTIIIKVVF